MDLGDYWQENKRFVLGVLAGAVVFFIGLGVVRSFFADDLRARRREIAQRRSDLAVPMYAAEDLADARLENEELAEVVERLRAAARFVPRERFRLAPGAGASNAQYLRTLAEVRDDLLRRANRSGLALDATLGMPDLSPTRDSEIERYLEALDLVENLASLALRAEVDALERIRIRLDPGLRAREGLGDVERTRATFTVVGSSDAVTRLLTWTRRPPEGRVLQVEGVELAPSRADPRDIRLELTLLVVRLPPGPGEVPEDVS